MWLDDTTIKFTNIYSSLEFLWNTRLPIYKNKYSRQIATLKYLYKIKCVFSGSVYNNVKIRIHGFVEHGRELG